MQSYAARFAKTLDDWTPRFPDPEDRPLNKRLVGYFYTGIEPEPLRSLIKHFPVDHVSDVFHQLRVQCTASVVEMVDLKTEKSFRERQFRARQQQQIPEPSRPLGGERRTKTSDSAGTQLKPLLGGEDPQFLIFDCDNCGGTHKSMNCKAKCRLCKSHGLNDDHIQFHCPKVTNAVERKQLQSPRHATGSPPLSIKSAASKSHKSSVALVKSAVSRAPHSGASMVSSLTQDTEYSEDESEVSDYPVYVDTCASDIYTPLVSNLDANSSHIHHRVTDQLKVEQADGTKLVSSGLGTLAGAPAFVMPAMSDTLLGANTVCRLGNLMLVDNDKIICVGSDANTRASLTEFYEYIRRNANQVKFTAYADNGCYKVLRSKIKDLTNKRTMAKLISRYETVQFSDLYHFVRFSHNISRS